MMERKAALLFAVILAGFAMSPERAQQYSDYQLCELYYSPIGSDGSKQILKAEADARKLNCEIHREMAERAWGAAMGSLSTGLKSTGEALAPKRKTIDCIRTSYGATCSEQ